MSYTTAFNKVRQAIQGAVKGSGVVVSLAEGGAIGGASPKNIVNRITRGGQGGVQIEQSMKARAAYAAPIALAVAGVIAAL